jgi:putative hemolysin
MNLMSPPEDRPSLRRKLVRKISSRVKRVRDSVRTLRSALEELEAQFQLNRRKIHAFQPHEAFEFDRGNYQVRLARDGRDLEMALRLRFEVFHREFMGKGRRVGVDLDRLDFLCDHLMIVDRKSEKVVGTYRLNSSRFNDQFYSEGEFAMDELLDRPGHKLEMGRACIEKSHRTGIVMALLWRGISQYMAQTNTAILFGCASVKTTDPLEIVSVTRWLADQGAIDSSFSAEPKRKYRVPHFRRLSERLERNPMAYDPLKAKEMVPPLFLSYLKAGARVAAVPALDREFGCIDFLTILELDKMSPIFAKKYRSPDVNESK